MTATISDIIKELKTKFIEVNDKYKEQLSNCVKLSEKLNTLTASLEEKEQQQALLIDEISTLKQEISSLNEKATKPFLAEDKDAEIDLLVREIEHCINQLKSH